jgi:hypothetical protein
MIYLQIMQQPKFATACLTQIVNNKSISTGQNKLTPAVKSLELPKMGLSSTC